MGVKWIGPTYEVDGEQRALANYPGIPTRDIDDAELTELARATDQTRAQLVKLLTQELPRMGPLYERTDKPEKDEQPAKAESRE